MVYILLVYACIGRFFENVIESGLHALDGF